MSGTTHARLLQAGMGSFLTFDIGLFGGAACPSAVDGTMRLVCFRLVLFPNNMGHRKSVSISCEVPGIQRVFVWYSGVFGIVFKVFGFFA